MIKDDQKDLLLVFTPVSINFTNGTIIDAVYEITAIETSNNSEVWKSEFHYKSFLGTQTYVRVLAKKIFEKLKADSIF